MLRIGSFSVLAIGFMLCLQAIPAPTVPTPGYAAIKNDLSPDANGYCHGAITFQYTLRSLETHRAFEAEINSDCSVEIHSLRESDGGTFAPSGILYVMSYNQAHPDYWVDSTLAIAAGCPVSGVGNYGDGDSAWWIVDPHYDPYPVAWSPALCTRGHEQVWDTLYQGGSPSPYDYHLIAGVSGSKTVICEWQTVWGPTGEVALRGDSGCEINDENQVFAPDIDTIIAEVLHNSELVVEIAGV